MMSSSNSRPQSERKNESDDAWKINNPSLVLVPVQVPGAHVVSSLSYSWQDMAGPALFIRWTYEIINKKTISASLFCFILLPSNADRVPGKGLMDESCFFQGDMQTRANKHTHTPLLLESTLLQGQASGKLLCLFHSTAKTAKENISSSCS